MSRENVELVRRGYEAWNGSGELDFDLLDPQIEWHTAAAVEASVVHRGHEGVRARGRGRESGIELEMRMGNVWTIRGRRAVRLEMYATPAEALEAVELAE